jgi:trk system potassium uptake protein TrkA
MFVLIVGSGRLGIGLARAMSSRHDDVVIVDNGLDDGRMGEVFDGVIVDGDPMDLEVLELAGIRNAELFIAVAADDNVNVFCVEAATTLFGVPKSLARIADPDRELFFREIGMQTVCPTVSGINQVLEFILEDRFSALATNLDPSLICVHPLQSWVGKPCSSVQIPDRMKIVGILKHGNFTKLYPKEILRQEDTVVISREREKERRIWIA